MTSNPYGRIPACLIIGMIAGSFGSVLLTRTDYPRSRSSIRSMLIGRSRCPQCGHTLTRKNLVPLVSWLIAHGRCTSCHATISTMYPVLEGASAIMLCLGWWTAGMISDDTLFHILFAGQRWLLTLLAVWDWYRGYLHITIWLISLIGRCAMILLFPDVWQYANRINPLWIIGGFITLYVFAGRYAGKKMTGHWGTWREGLGEGDLWLMIILAPIMLLTSWNHPVDYLARFWLSSGLVSIGFVGIRFWSGQKNQQTIAFFPGLIGGCLGLLIFSLL